MSVLFLSHRIPFPPNRGDKIRSHHVLQALAALPYPVHAGCFADNLADKVEEGALAQRTASYCLIRRKKPLWLAGVQALLQRKPVSLTAFYDKRLAAWVKQVLKDGRVGSIYVFSGQMGQYLPAEWKGRIVVDLVDVDSAKFAALAQSANPLFAWIYKREARLLAREELRLAHRANHTLLISDEEADLLRAALPQAGGSSVNIAVMGNGIDTAFFAPDYVPLHAHQSDLNDRAKGPHFVFTGQMDYAPNVTATLRMADAILPLIRTHYPDAAFHIIGRSPGLRLRKLDGVNGCHVWGEVRDTRPFLAQADIVIAPLSVARGVQNKVLEAMAMGRPVLLSPGAATGIPATDGRHFIIAESDQDFATCAIAMLNNSGLCKGLGDNARAFVTQHRNWSAMLAPLAPLIHPVQEGACGDA